MKEPISLLNISYTEARGDVQLLEANVLVEKKKLAKGTTALSSVFSAEKTVADQAAKWKQERPKIVALFPGVQLKDAYLKPWKIAEIVGLEELHRFQYILYCNFTHSTLRGAFSWPDMMPALDQSTVVDTNHRGWWLLFPLINLVFAVTEGENGSNEFGPGTVD